MQIIDKIINYFKPARNVGIGITSQVAPTTNQHRCNLSERFAAYDGVYSPSLKPTPYDLHGHDNVSEPIAKEIIDIQVNFLISKGVSFHSENKKHKEYLDAVLKANDFDCKLREAAHLGHISGDVFVKILPAADSVSYPEIVVLDSCSVEVDTATDDYKTAAEYRVTSQSKAINGATIYTRQRTTRELDQWIIRDEESSNNKDWYALSTVVYPAPFSPIIHIQHLHKDKSYFGTSELEPQTIKSITDINFISSTIKRINRLYSQPYLYASGVNVASTINFSPGVIPQLPTGAKIEKVDNSADIESLQKEREERRNSIFESLSIPSVVFGKIGVFDNISGIAIKLQYAPLTSKNFVKQNSYGELLETLAARIIYLGGYSDLAEFTVEWRDALPVNESEELTNIMEKVQSKLLSKRTASTMLGINYDAEKALIEIETQEDAAQNAILFNRGL